MWESVINMFKDSDFNKKGFSAERECMICRHYGDNKDFCKGCGNCGASDCCRCVGSSDWEEMQREFPDVPYGAEMVPISEDEELYAVYDDAGHHHGFIEMDDDEEEDAIDIDISDEDMNEVAEVRLDSESFSAEEEYECSWCGKDVKKGDKFYFVDGAWSIDALCVSCKEEGDDDDADWEKLNIKGGTWDAESFSADGRPQGMTSTQFRHKKTGEIATQIPLYDINDWEEMSAESFGAETKCEGQEQNDRGYCDLSFDYGSSGITSECKKCGDELEWSWDDNEYGTAADQEIERKSPCELGDDGYCSIVWDWGTGRANGSCTRCNSEYEFSFPDSPIGFDLSGDEIESSLVQQAKGIDTLAKPFEEIGVPLPYARLGVMAAGLTALAFGVKQYMKK